MTEESEVAVLKLEPVEPDFAEPDPVEPDFADPDSEEPDSEEPDSEEPDTVGLGLKTVRLDASLDSAEPEVATDPEAATDPVFVLPLVIVEPSPEATTELPTAAKDGVSSVLLAETAAEAAAAASTSEAAPPDPTNPAPAAVLDAA